MKSMQKQCFAALVERLDCIDQIILDFPDIRCGIRHLIQEQDMPWEF